MKWYQIFYQYNVSKTDISIMNHVYGTVFIILMVSGCGGHVFHQIERGETLYSISWMYGHDYRKVAQWNQIKSPFVIKTGERLRVAPPVGEHGHKQMATESQSTKRDFRDRSRSKNRDLGFKDKHSHADKKNEATGHARNGYKRKNRSDSRDSKKEHALNWRWPTKGGKLVEKFNGQDPGKKGLDIAGREGQPIYSATSGQVVYSGGGLPRYGKLIIVKHSNKYLSAYAHNKNLLVREGDKVKAGQHIADMGSSGTSNTKLHFEIRRNGKAIDPLRLLPKPML